MIINLFCSAQVSIRNVVDSKEINDVISIVSKDIKTINDYNFKNIKFVFSEQTPNYGSYVINNINFDTNQSVNEVITFISENKNYRNLYFVKTISKDKTINILEIINLDKTLNYSTNFNLNENTIYYANTMRRPCGQALIDCINDAYSNHGCFNWIVFTSAFIPETAVVVAAACYDRNCH